MALDRKILGTFVVAVGVVLFLVGLLAAPAMAQQTSDKAICQAVISIVVNNSANNEQNQEATSGDNNLNNNSTQYTTTGDNNVDNGQNQETITGDNVNEIAQELNVAPTIVQNCAEEGGVNIDDNGTTGGTTADDSTTDDGDTSAIEGKENVVEGTEAGDLPDTGGLEVIWTSGVLLIGAGLVMWRMVNRRF